MLHKLRVQDLLNYIFKYLKQRDGYMLAGQKQRGAGDSLSHSGLFPPVGGEEIDWSQEGS